jgi:hypothetical protein
VYKWVIKKEFVGIEGEGEPSWGVGGPNVSGRSIHEVTATAISLRR